MKAIFCMGPSGSGKTTLSAHLANIYRNIFGKQTVTLVNLDPANCLSSNVDVDINQLVTVQDVMEEYELGPNGAIIYAMEFLASNISWLIHRLIQKPGITSHMYIFDLPGQIELYINNQCVKKSVQAIIDATKSTACIIEAFDCTYMHDINQFISLCMTSLSSMINFQMPHINLLNKVDILKASAEKPSRGFINEYFNMNSAAELVAELQEDQPNNPAINVPEQVAKLIDIYGQVSFFPCSLYKPDLICNLIYELERIFGTIQISNLHQPFADFVKQYDMFSNDRAMTELEQDLEDGEEQEHIIRFNNDID